MSRPVGDPEDWSVCQDAEHGFTLRHPPDWLAKGPPGRCIQLQRGEPTLPGGVPEVDVFIRVLPLEGAFPSDYLRDDLAPKDQPLQVGSGVAYSDRTELLINGLPAVRARFRSTGATPNWGIEYAIRKNDRILDAYISQPAPAIEADFDRVIGTLEW